MKCTCMLRPLLSRGELVTAVNEVVILLAHWLLISAKWMLLCVGQHSIVSVFARRWRRRWSHHTACCRAGCKCSMLSHDWSSGQETTSMRYRLWYNMEIICDRMNNVSEEKHVFHLLKLPQKIRLSSLWFYMVSVANMKKWKRRKLEPITFGTGC